MPLTTGIGADLHAHLTAIDFTHTPSVIESLHAPKNAATPLIVFQQVGGSRDHDLSGADGNVDGTWQITAYSTDMLIARRIAATIRIATDGYTGQMPSGGGTEINRCFLDNEIEGSDPPSGGGGVWLEKIVQTYSIAWEETKPNT